MSREEAYQLLTKYLHNKNLIKHCLASEAAMKGIYRYLHASDLNEQTEEIWGITGLLHDVDYEIAQMGNKLDKHGFLIFEHEPNSIPEPIAHAIKAHNFENTKVEPVSDMDWAIAIVDGLTGFIVACALVRPNKKLEEVTVDAIVKKMGDKAFSRNVNRELIKLCEEKLGIKLEKFIEITLISMQKISNELGL